jgi:hypothetical protein
MRIKLLFLLSVFVLAAGCSSSEKKSDTTRSARDLGASGRIPGLPRPALALVPKARFYTGQITPVISHINPKSVAQRYNFKVGDQLISLNGERIISALEFDLKIRHAPTLSLIGFRRGGKLMSTKILLGMDRPRFGAGFEPIGVAWVKKSSPYVSFMFQNEIMAYAETSINEEQTLLHVNVILDSTKIILLPRVKYSVFDRGNKTMVSSGLAKVDALGSGSQIFTKAISKKTGFKGPISVALDVEGKQFHFEFQ